MPSRLTLDSAFLDRAVAVSGARTGNAAVTLALQEIISRREQSRLVDLFGTLEWNDLGDCEAERSRE